MKKLSLLLLAVLILLACFTGCQDTEDPHTHLFENATVIKSPCIVAGEEVATCACGETRSTAILPTGKHIYENGVCIGCNQNEIPLYDVTSAYDADGDGQEEVYYFSPVLSNRFDDAVHLSAGDYDRSLSSSSVGNSSYNAIGHWYVAYRSEQSIVYRVTVAESGRYEMALHLYIDDMDAHGAQYTVNSGSDKAENFETSFRFNKTDYREARNAATCGTYMYGITVNGNTMENRTHGSVHISFLHGLDNTRIRKFLGHDHRERSKGIGHGMSFGVGVVVIVRTMAENTVTAAKHFIVQSTAIFHVIDQPRAVIAHFNTEKTLV